MLDCVIVPFLLSQAKSFSRNGYTSFMKVKADCEKEENEMKWLGLYLARAVATAEHTGAGAPGRTGLGAERYGFNNTHNAF